MRAELRKLQEPLTRSEEPVVVPDGQTLRPGTRDARIKLLRARLAQLGFNPQISGMLDANTDRFDRARMAGDEDQ